MTTQPNGIDVTCTPVHGSLTCLSRGNTAGLTMAVAASLLSLGSVLYAVFIIVVTNANRPTSNGFRIFYNSMDILVFALLFADSIQAIGGLLSLKWVRDGVVQVGMFCDAQGTLKTLGETGVALTTLLIGIYTFVGVSTGRGLQSMKITGGLVVGIWIFVGMLIGVGHAANKYPYMSPVPYWCWIGTNRTWRLVGEYLWMWISLFASCLLYIPLYLWMRGNLTFPLPESPWYAWSFQWKSNPKLHSTRRRALIMLMYPIVYCVCILPLSIVRWKSFDEEAKHGVSKTPSESTFAVITIFGLSGFFNVILVFTTKPNLGLFGQQEVTSSSGRAPEDGDGNQLTPETESVRLSMGRYPSQVDQNIPRRRLTGSSVVV